MDVWMAKFAFWYSEIPFLDDHGENFYCSDFGKLLCFGSHAFVGSILIRRVVYVLQKRIRVTIRVRGFSKRYLCEHRRTWPK